MPPWQEHTFNIYAVLGDDGKAYMNLVVDAGGWGELQDRRYVDMTITTSGLLPETGVIYSDDPANPPWCAHRGARDPIEIRP